MASLNRASRSDSESVSFRAPALRRPASNEDLDAGLGSQLSQRARTGALRSQAIVDGARRFRRHDSRLTAIWTFHRHGSLLRDQDRAPFGGQLGASTPNCLAYEAGAEALPLWEEIWPGPAMKLVGPLAARSPGLRLALASSNSRAYFSCAQRNPQPPQVEASSGSIAVRKDGGNPRAGLIGMIGIMLNA